MLKTNMLAATIPRQLLCEASDALQACQKATRRQQVHQGIVQNLRRSTGKTNKMSQLKLKIDC